MLNLFYIEFEKLFRRRRTYIGVLAVIIIILVIQIGMKVEGQSIIDFISESLRTSFILQGNLLNGYLIAYLSFNSLWIHIPILIVMVTGDLISGESSNGTFRLSLTRPIRRSGLLLAKFLAGMIYVLLLVSLLAGMSLGLGLLFFGSGDLIVFLNAINIIPSASLFSRFLMAFGYGLISMWMVASLSFLFSVLFNNSITPILWSIVVLILFTVLSNFEIGIFNSFRPYLFTTYLNNWRLFFEFKLNLQEILFSVFILVMHIIVLLSVSISIFNRKDITS